MLAVVRTYKQNGYEARLHENVMNSPAYRDLKPPARALLFEFVLIYRPDRNGYLSISEKRAMELIKSSEKTTARAFYELSEHGFIKVTKHQVWANGMAREWRLTFKQTGSREPTNEYLQWEKDNNMFPELNRPPWLR